MAEREVGDDLGSRVHDRMGSLLSSESDVLPSSPAPPSAGRAWFYLILLCLQRQARAQQMVWIALALLGFTTTVVALITASSGWGMGHRRWTFEIRTRLFPSNGPIRDTTGFLPPPPHAESILIPRVIELTYDQTATGMELLPRTGTWPAPAASLQDGIATACRQVLDRSGFMVFGNWVVFSVFLSFLLPIWSLSFATDTLGGEREAGTLIWLLTRPLSRPAIYLAKYVALLPWALGLNLGGFAVLCLAAGKPGYLALRLFWPAVFWGTLAFCALFHLFSAWVRRPAVVAIVYTFFLETLLGNLPGYLKRVSISFYTHCLMFDALGRYGISPPEKESVYLPVDGTTAWCMLVGGTIVLLLVGMVVFARSEYQDVS